MAVGGAGAVRGARAGAAGRAHPAGSAGVVGDDGSGVVGLVRASWDLGIGLWYTLEETPDGRTTGTTAHSDLG